MQQLLDGVVAFLPSPAEAEPAHGFSTDGKDKELVRNATDEESFSAQHLRLSVISTLAD